MSDVHSTTYQASECIDNNIAVGDFCHTKPGKSLHWLEITLKDAQQLSSVQVFQRKGYWGLASEPKRVFYRLPTALILYDKHGEVYKETYDWESGVWSTGNVKSSLGQLPTGKLIPRVWVKQL